MAKPKILTTGFIARKRNRSETQTRRDLDRIGCPRDVFGRRTPTVAHLRQLEKLDRARAGKH